MIAICGITAISTVDEGSSIFAKRNFMRLAVLAIESRGPDATGFAWTAKDAPAGQPTWYWKEAKTAREAIHRAELDHADITVAIGHTRYATKGPKSDNANNHPVIDDGILLVHNGVVTNDAEIYKMLGDDWVKKAQVDTAAVAALLANPSLLYAAHPVDLLGLIEGDAALAWIDMNEPNVLHLARHQGRPLTYGHTRKGDLVMSSTPETLRNLSRMANVKIRNIVEVPEGTYLRVEAGVITDTRTFKIPERKKVQYHVSNPSGGYYNDRVWVQGEGWKPKPDAKPGTQVWIKGEGWVSKDPTTPGALVVIGGQQQLTEYDTAVTTTRDTQRTERQAFYDHEAEVDDQWWSEYLKERYAKIEVAKERELEDLRMYLGITDDEDWAGYKSFVAEEYGGFDKMHPQQMIDLADDYLFDDELDDGDDDNSFATVAARVMDLREGQ